MEKIRYFGTNSVYPGTGLQYSVDGAAKHQATTGGGTVVSTPLAPHPDNDVDQGQSKLH